MMAILSPNSPQRQNQLTQLSSHLPQPRLRQQQLHRITLGESLLNRWVWVCETVIYNGAALQAVEFPAADSKQIDNLYEIVCCPTQCHH